MVIISLSFMRDIVIVEDEFFAANHLKTIIENLNYKVIKIFYTGEEFIEQKEMFYDVVILDIQLAGKITGIEIGEYLQHKNIPFFFVTSNTDSFTLKKAVNLKPITYISKPFKEIDITVAMELLMVNIPGTIDVITKRGNEELDISTILFIKADGVYVDIFTENATITQRKLLREIIEKLPNHFKRIHRSYIINTHKISARKSTHLLIGNHKVPISRAVKNVF